MNRCFREPLVTTLAGGRHGGGAQLTAMHVPRHLAQRYELAEGQQIRIRLRGETIHLMSQTESNKQEPQDA